MVFVNGARGGEVVILLLPLSVILFIFSRNFAQGFLIAFIGGAAVLLILGELARVA